MHYQKTHIKPIPSHFDDEGMQYLDSRWLDAPVAKRMRISAIGGYVYFPYSINGEIIRWKYRSIHDKKEQRWTSISEDEKENWKAPFFNQIEPWDTKYLIITEGEFDCMTMIQLGASNCVSLPNGAASVESTFRNNYQFLQKFDTIYIAFDMDEAGKKAADQAMKMLPASKFRRIIFPEGETSPKDANAWLIDTAARTEDLARLLVTALRPQSDVIQHAADICWEAFDEIDIGYSTGWGTVDNMIGGIRKKELTLVSAETGCGKTTFCINLAVNLLNQGVGVWINSFEMDKKVVLRKLASIALGKSLRTRAFHEHERTQFTKWCIDKNIYINPKNAGNSIHELRKAFEIAVLAFGVQVVVLDHLDYIQSKGSQNSIMENVDEVMRELHTMAMEFDVSVILVAHPKQAQGQIKPLDLNSLKGSSSIKQYSDNIIFLTRMDMFDPNEKNKTKLNVAKNRLIGTQGVVTLLYCTDTDTFQEPKIPFTGAVNPYRGY